MVDFARDDASDPVRSFRDWQEACLSLRVAEACGAPHADILRLAAEVLRTRNVLILDRLHAGWNAPDVVVRNLIIDEQLLREKDDARLSEIGRS